MAKKKVRLKFKASMPLPLEHAMVQKFGFTIESRLKGHYIVFVRDRPVPAIRDKKTVTEQRKKGLIERCNTMASFYMTPELHVRSIRTRLINFAQTLSEAERHFVEAYVDEKYPEGNVIALSDMRQRG